MEIKELLFALSSRDAIGAVSDAADFAKNELSAYCDRIETNGLTVIGTVKGESDYTLMLDAHIDQVGMMVTHVDDDGFLSVDKAGGLDLRSLPSGRVTVHGREKLTAVICSTPPHLAKGEVSYDDIAKLKVDTGLGCRAKDLVAVGDFVTFQSQPLCLSGRRVSGRSFDDRAGVCCLLETARRLKGRKLPISVSFVLSDAEELGMRGVRGAAFRVEPMEAVAVDVTFGDGKGIKESECGKLGAGPKIGVSASLDSRVTAKLIATAETGKIPFALEPMGDLTSTNADFIGVSRCGVPCGTVSIPLRNMHSRAEVLDLDDLDRTCDLLCAYILAGGIAHD